jgi:hypothetical protein
MSQVGLGKITEIDGRSLEYPVLSRVESLMGHVTLDPP